MPSKSAFAALAAVLTFAASVAGPALAQQPRPMPATAAPQAADQTLGVAIMSAYVLQDGSLFHGSGVVSSEKTSMGTYIVKFNRTLRGCVSTAKAGNDAVIVSGGQLDVGGGYLGEIVVLRDHAGAPYSGDFQLIVFCSM